MLSRLAVFAVAGWLVLGGAALADGIPAVVPAATGEPLRIGNVSHDVSPAGFVYTVAPGAPAAPPELRRSPRHRNPGMAKPVPRKHAASPDRTAAN